MNGGMSRSTTATSPVSDTVTANLIQAQAQANYALNPILEIPCRASRCRAASCPPTVPSTPRPSCCLRGFAAYSLDDRTVIRGGIGLFSHDYFSRTSTRPASQATPILVTNDNGITFTGANRPIRSRAAR